MNKTGILMALVLAGLLYTQGAFAEARSWQIDPAHSGFYFTVDHIFSKVRGQFNTFSGSVNFDPAHLTESSMKFVLEVESIDTNIAKRDKHLQSADFFDEGNFPEMSFESVSITTEGNNEYLVAGKFTVKGKSYDMTLPLVLAGIKDHPSEKGKEVAGFNGTFVIDRLAYGIGSGKFVDLGVVGREVEVLVTFEVLSDKE
jgi:polyisoprenoid-binding protein YceI